jgi:hypothetical protein
MVLRSIKTENMVVGISCAVHATRSIRKDLRVFKNWVLRRIFGPRGDEVAGDWRKLRKEELFKLSPSPNNIRQIKSKIRRE